MSEPIGAAGSSQFSYASQPESDRARVPKIDNQGNAKDPVTGEVLSNEEFNEILKELQMQAEQDAALAEKLRELQEKLDLILSGAQSSDAEEASSSVSSPVVNKVFSNGA